LNPKTHNLSLQGITGVLFGVISILFITLISKLINQFTSSSGATSVLPITFFEILIILCVILFVLIAYLVIVFTNKRRRKKSSLNGWESNAKKIRLIFFIQFVFLVLASYICIQLGVLKLIAPLILLIYGVSCIIANHYTNGYSKILGLFFTLQSMLALFFPEVQFLLLGVAFGGFHIIYATLNTKSSLHS